RLGLDLLVLALSGQLPFHAALGLLRADLLVVRLAGAVVVDEVNLGLGALLHLDGVGACGDALDLEDALGAAERALEGLDLLVLLRVVGADREGEGEDERQAQQRVERGLHRDNLPLSDSLSRAGRGPPPDDEYSRARAG